MPQECTRTQMRTHYPLPAIMQAKDVRNRLCQNNNSRTPALGWVSIFGCRALLQELWFFLSRELKADCALSCLTPGSPLASAGAQTGNTSTRQVPTLSRASESSAG